MLSKVDLVLALIKTYHYGFHERTSLLPCSILLTKHKRPTTTTTTPHRNLRCTIEVMCSDWRLDVDYVKERGRGGPSVDSCRPNSVSCPAILGEELLREIFPQTLLEG